MYWYLSKRTEIFLLSIINKKNIMDRTNNSHTLTFSHFLFLLIPSSQTHYPWQTNILYWCITWYIERMTTERKEKWLAVSHCYFFHPYSHTVIYSVYSTLPTLIDYKWFYKSDMFRLSNRTTSRLFQLSFHQVKFICFSITHSTPTSHQQRAN
jgi:hypothetical protein